jgi:hypothetical protein
LALNTISVTEKDIEKEDVQDSVKSHHFKHVTGFFKFESTRFMSMQARHETIVSISRSSRGCKTSKEWGTEIAAQIIQTKFAYN